jgi:outer membrane protein assembly factor BamB
MTTLTMTAIADVSMPISPALAGERVVAVGHAGHVHLIDTATGRTLWSRGLAATQGASACDGRPVTVTIADETVIAGSQGHVFALKLEDGAILWHVDLRGRGAGETSLAVGGPIGDYVASLGPIGGERQ